MAATSEVQLVNRALTLLGESRIASLTDNTPQALSANAIYAQVRDDVLSEGRWNCAIKRATLALLEADPVWGFQNLFQLPTDFIRLDRIRDMRDDFAIEEDKLATDVDEMSIRYVFRITDVAKMDAPLQTAIAYKMAHELAIALKASDKKREAMYQMYKDQMADARFRDAQQSPVQAVDAYAWVDGRDTGLTEPFVGIESP